MATMSCEPADVNRALLELDIELESYRKHTLCLNCEYNKNHEYKAYNEGIIASFCMYTGDWLEQDEYMSTIYDMGCEV